jgi:hypothetical protein
MLELPERWRSILCAIRDGAVAWRDPRELAGELPGPADAALDAMAEMHVAGWLEVWERDDGLAVTLSPLAAERLGTRLVETRRPDRSRWSRPDEPRRNIGPPSAPADTCPTAAEPRDERGPEPRTAEPGTGAPTLLVGVGLCPWPGPRQAGPPAPCPACRGARLGPDAYCLWCDRWGRSEDRPTPRPGRPARPRPPTGPDAERARRRARRKALLKARAARTAPRSARKSQPAGTVRQPIGP